MSLARTLLTDSKLLLAAIAALTLFADSIIMLMVYRRRFTSEDQYQPLSG